jgi:pimeloyl-ACP methyl ester carboxylesterase
VSTAVELHVEEYGAGDPAIVGLHGFAGSARNFRPQARFLRDRHRVILFDARGHARSAAPEDDDEYTPEAFVDDLKRVVARANGARVVVMGMSMGAAIALRYALRYPESLVGLVLASYPPAGDASSPPWALTLADALDATGAEVAGERYVWGGGRFDEAGAKLIRQGFLEHRPRALSATLRRVLAVEPAVSARANFFRSLEVPTLLIAGERDVPSREATRELEALLPHATRVVIPGAGHVANLEKPESFNEALRGFLSGIEGAT